MHTGGAAIPYLRPLLSVWLGLLVGCAVPVWASTIATTATITPAPAAQLIADYSSGYRALGIAQLNLSYAQNIQAILDEPDTASQRVFFKGIQKRLQTADAQGATDCEKLHLKILAFEVGTHLQKLDVVDKFVEQGGRAKVSPEGLASMPMGQDWYRYFLKRWLTLETTPEALMAFGKQELAQALLRYRALQSKMGFEGKDAAFYAYLATEQFFYPEGQTPLADYEARQATVYRNLHKLFLVTEVQPARVMQSTRGAAMPADAYYDTDTRTFYFNRAKPRFERRNVDWLLLHESTPGHHYQTSYARLRQACPAPWPSVFYAAFAEGWSAYVEEFGEPLGLYRQDSDALGAVEWDLVRSVRVVLDVGINHEGWSPQQARQYWQQMLPMLPDLAEREIARVRNWPVQAITYKRGAALFRELRAQARARQGAAFDIRLFHDQALKHGGMPLAVLPGWVLGGDLGLQSVGFGDPVVR